MSAMDSVLVIAGMFIVTFGVRFMLFARAHKVEMPSFLDRALKFVPVAVLTSIIALMAFVSEHQLNVSLENPWLLGALAAFIVGLWRQQQLLTILIGVVVFFVAKYAFS